MNVSQPVRSARADTFDVLKQVDAGDLSVGYAADGAPRPDPASYVGMFSGKYTHRTITGGIGHNLPQEAPQAIIDVDRF